MEIEIFGEHTRGLSVGAAAREARSSSDSKVLAWPGRLPIQETPEARDEVTAAQLAPPSTVLTIAEALTVRETRFFRDVLPFELLRLRLLPRLLRARQDSRRLRVWSAGCSTGQEAWSLAMLLREVVPQQPAWQIELLATDISVRALETARAGSYRREQIVQGLDRRRRQRFFEADHDDEAQAERWQATPALRQGVTFRRHDQREPMIFDRRSRPRDSAESPVEDPALFDVVLMRNVLLYMTPAERTAALAEVHRVLAPDGVLLLGVLEQAEEFSDLFHAELDEECYFYRPITGSRGAYWHSTTPWRTPRIE